MRFVLHVDRFLVSWMMVVVSAWAALVLTLPPSNFATFPVSFRLAMNTHIPEWAFGALFGVGAGAHCGGLIMRAFCRLIPLARVLGFIGVSLESSAWVYFGGITVISNPDTLFGMCGLVMGVGGFWRMSRYWWAADV